MDEMGDIMDKPYLREFLFVSSHFYLKNIVFQHGPGRQQGGAWQMLRDIVFFLDWGGDNKNKPYLHEFLFVFIYFYLKNIVFMCKKKAWVDNRMAFDGCGAMLWFYGLKGWQHGQTISLWVPIRFFSFLS